MKLLSDAQYNELLNAANISEARWRTIQNLQSEAHSLNTKIKNLEELMSSSENNQSRQSDELAKLRVLADSRMELIERQSDKLLRQYKEIQGLKESIGKFKEIKFEQCKDEKIEYEVLRNLAISFKQALEYAESEIEQYKIKLKEAECEIEQYEIRLENIDIEDTFERYHRMGGLIYKPSDGAFSNSRILLENTKLTGDVQRLEKEIKDKNRRILELMKENLKLTMETDKELYGTVQIEEQFKIDVQIEEQFKIDIQSSQKWQEIYDEQVEKSKQLVKQRKACICNTNWTVDGSKTKGKKMTEDGIKIALMSFDTVVDRACNYVTVNNYEKLRHKVELAFNKINKLNSVNQISITHEYLESKLAELETIHKYRLMKQQEKEKTKEIKRKAAEERREKERLEAEERKLQLELDRQRQIEESARVLVKQQLDENIKLINELQSKGEEVGKLEELVSELKSKLEESEKNQQLAEKDLIEQIVDIQDRKETLQAGFVYVISNYGAFGENIFKIGVTRREDPLERVNELGNASVPFRFNVHSIIPSEEAFKLEHTIHKRLRKYRVNLVNNRKEFFKIDIQELQSILSELVENLEFSSDITEEQYIETCQIRNNPVEFDKWLSSYQETTNDDDEEKQYKMLGIVDISALSNNKNYISTEEYENYYNLVAELLDGFSSKPVMRVTKYYVAVYLALETNMKKLVTFYKNGDGGSINSFSIKGYAGAETSGQRKSISIDKFDVDTYGETINNTAIEIDNQLIDLCSINI